MTTPIPTMRSSSPTCLLDYAVNIACGQPTVDLRVQVAGVSAKSQDTTPGFLHV